MIRRTMLSVALLTVATVGAVTAAGGQTLIPWRHGTVSPKGDAGFFFMAAEGGFARD